MSSRLMTVLRQRCELPLCPEKCPMFSKYCNGGRLRLGSIPQRPGERMWRCIRLQAVGLHHRWSAWQGTGITARLTRTLGIGTSADSAAAIVERAKRLMPPRYVEPYVKRQKNDASDAKAIRAYHQGQRSFAPQQQANIRPHPITAPNHRISPCDTGATQDIPGEVSVGRH